MYSQGFGMSQTQGFSQSETKRVREAGVENFVPVTVCIIKAAAAARIGDDALKFHGMAAGMLLLVGVAEAVVKQELSLELTLDDGTGRIKVRHYFTGDGPNSLDAITPGVYIRCVGEVRSAPALHVSAVGLQACGSADEVSYHMIEVAHAALKLAAHVPKLKFDPKAFPEVPMSQMPASLSQSSPSLPAASPDFAGSRGTQGGGALVGDGLKEAVLDRIRAEDNERGIDVLTIIACLRTASDKDIRATLADLVVCGEIYTTIDEDHFGIV